MITWHTGQKVHTTYCGGLYQGQLNDNTRPTPDARNTIYAITLTNPITVYGSIRNKIEIWSNSRDTIRFD